MYLEITGVDLRKFIKEVYNLSSPLGMGILQFREGELDEPTVDQILAWTGYPFIRLEMDYVHGRSCKMGVWQRGGRKRLFIDGDWYDHNDEQLAELLKRCGIERKEVAELPKIGVPNEEREPGECCPVCAELDCECD